MKTFFYLNSLFTLLCVLFLFVSPIKSAPCTLKINISNDAKYSVSIGGEEWFEGGETAVYIGKWFSTTTNTLKLSSPPVISTGSDQIGTFNQTTFTFSANENTPFIATVKDYTIYSQPNDPNSCLIVFEQQFPEGASNTQTNTDLDKSTASVCSIFPSLSLLNLNSQQQRGYFEYYDMMIGAVSNGTKHGIWDSNTKISGGPKSGPLVVFNRQTEESVVLSSWSNFMVGNIIQNGSNINFGIMGSIESLPKPYSYSTALFAGPTVRQAVNAFGYTLSYLVHNKTPVADITQLKLGYSTDNGAYYYYHTDDGLTYQDQMLKLYDYIKAEEIPVQHMLYDSWWYYRGPTSGVVNWTTRPDVFPDGFNFMYNKTKWPVQAHNRYWDAQTVYAKQNGGNFNFIIDGEYAIPDDEALWDHLFANASSWGLTVYEQDWLHNEWEYLTSTKTSATLAQRWLEQMASAAERAGIKIQYCMGWARFALASVQFSAVNQMRVSDDYFFDLLQVYDFPDNLYLGVSSLLAHSVGLRSSKDVFWTTSVQSTPVYGNATGPYPPIHSVVASYSRGPVTMGDSIGYINKTLTMMSCMKDGTLLQPTSPFVAINEYFVYKSFGQDGPAGEVWHSDTIIGEYVWHHLIAVILSDFYEVNYHTFTQGTDKGNLYILYDHSFEQISYFEKNSILTLEPVQISNFSLNHLAPILDSGWALLGELEKWVPVSSQRFQNIQSEQNEIIVTINGVIGENITIVLAYLNTEQKIEKKSFSCVFVDSNVITLSSSSSSISKSFKKYDKLIPKELTPISDVNGDVNDIRSTVNSCQEINFTPKNYH